MPVTIQRATKRPAVRELYVGFCIDLCRPLVEARVATENLFVSKSYSPALSLEPSTQACRWSRPSSTRASLQTGHRKPTEKRWRYSARCAYRSPTRSPWPHRRVHFRLRTHRPRVRGRRCSSTCQTLRLVATARYLGDLSRSECDRREPKVVRPLQVLSIESEQRVSKNFGITRWTCATF